MVVPVGAAGLYGGIASAVLLVALLQHVCPIEDQVSGLCFAGWYGTAESAAMAFGAAISATCATSLPALVAPSHKWQVSVVFFAAGSAYAVWFLASVGSSFLLEFVVAVGAGALVVANLFRSAKNAP
jgi:hypothetical protein